MIKITSSLSIPMSELTFVATTGSGPGGQHVNRVATKIVLLWDVGTSSSISSASRNRIEKKLTSRINKLGVLRVSSSRHRSQRANRSATIERFAVLLKEALTRPKIRKKTKVTRNQKAKRLDQKKQRSSTKSLRKPPKNE
jgi:ribosome-associated protein